MEFRGLRLEVSLDDDKVEKIYSALPAFALEKGQITLSEVKPKLEEKPHAQKLLVPREVKSYPTKQEVYAFIKSKPNYEISLPLICRNFLGFVPSTVMSNPERRYYDRMWDRVNRVKKIIAKEEDGEWKQRDGEERETIYWFVKKTNINDRGTTKQLTGENY